MVELFELRGSNIGVELFLHLTNYLTWNKPLVVIGTLSRC